jgi:hypothetical protein
MGDTADNAAQKNNDSRLRDCRISPTALRWRNVSIAGGQRPPVGSGLSDVVDQQKEADARRNTGLE